MSLPSCSQSLFLQNYFFSDSLNTLFVENELVVNTYIKNERSSNLCYLMKSSLLVN